MSEKKKTTKTTTTTRTSAVSILDFLSFWAVMLLAIVLVVNAFITMLGWFGVSIEALATFTGILDKIAMAIAIGVTIFCSYFAARKQRKKWFTVWIVAAILVGISFVLGIAVL